MTVRLTGAMSMRQNDFGGASSAIRMAARITAGWVTATKRARRRSAIPSSRAPGRSGRRRTRRRAVRASGRSARSPGPAGWTPPRTSPRQRPQSRSASRVSMSACRPSSSAVCRVRFSGPQTARSDGAELDRGVDLAVADRVERLVGGKSSGCHRVGHGMRHQGQPDDLTHSGPHAETVSCRFSPSSSRAMRARTPARCVA